jgi:NTP pyrophosphatase (non-canonical NTP hydrolase)
MAKSIEDITKLVTEFYQKRGWKCDDPNELMSSILIELGELAEHYQWKKKFEKWDEIKTKTVGFEFVDVVFYLLILAHQSGIDIEKYFDMKLPLLDKKFPPGKDVLEAREEYRKSGKNKLYE